MTSEHPRRQPNRLIHEQSPYLRQHAHNPVDWYPWSDEALARARGENRPILLSIGYSACHWCHVMERESFENEVIARLMNEHFVPIKVDREERPDLDQIYMDAVQLMTGRGGWPLTVFLTPDLKPFYGGTYFPPEDRQGMPGFRRVLSAIADVFENKPADVRVTVERLSRAMVEANRQVEPGTIKPGIVAAAARGLAQHYDPRYGGLGGAPKFPNTFVFSLFLTVFHENRDPQLAEMVRNTLTKMAKGGIYDQLGGGFHRYSVDERWLVPHFEKMLYDNALLARLYLDAGRALDQPEFLEIARETLDYLLREMNAPEGGFYSSQDADSEGEEGKFFVWTRAELDDVLGDDLAPLAARYFNVDEVGNFEGRNILHRTIDLAEAARLFRLSEQQAAAAIGRARTLLFEARAKRVHPGRDDKILAAWNGMAISALAEGYRALGEARYLESARRAADFVMERMWDGSRLHRSYKDGVARFNGYLEDYALIAGAMLDVYQAAFDRRYLDHAITLAEVMLEQFEDHENGGFYFTSDDHEALIIRPKPIFDGSTPSGNSAAVMTLLRLYAHTSDDRYLKSADMTLCCYASMMERQPFAFAHMLEALDLYERSAQEIVLISEQADAALPLWLRAIGRTYVPGLALSRIAPDEALSNVPEGLRGKTQIDHRLTAYLCRNRACSPPFTDLAQFEQALHNS